VRGAGGECFFQKALSPRIYISISLSSYLKSVVAFRANDIVFTFSLRKSEDGFTRRTFSVNVSFSVTPLIFPEPEEVQEFLIFGASLGDIS
jgi:hypothetical protein